MKIIEKESKEDDRYVCPNCGKVLIWIREYYKDPDKFPDDWDYKDNNFYLLEDINADGLVDVNNFYIWLCSEKCCFQFINKIFRKYKSKPLTYR